MLNFTFEFYVRNGLMPLSTGFIGLLLILVRNFDYPLKIHGYFGEKPLKTAPF
jgi:hypothetical protein